ncbi:MAG: hypothetical protein ACLRPW_13040 [Intestinibacter sp.]
MSIADAMIYIIGIDSKFKNNAEYEKFLNALSKDIDLDLKSYMGYMRENTLRLVNIQIL